MFPFIMFSLICPDMNSSGASCNRPGADMLNWVWFIIRANLILFSFLIKIRLGSQVNAGYVFEQK